jgi:ribonuclease D
VLSTPDELALGVRELEGAPRYYIDTEFESSKRGKRLSLIQVSRGDEVYIVDALALESLVPLAEVLFRANVEWVLHAGLQDVELLCERLGRDEPPAAFDTQVAWGLTGPEASVSLAFLQFRVLGIRSNKGYQADDWLRRPLPPAQLEYAARDIAHLPAIERHLRERAQKLGREHLIHEACREFLLPAPTAPVPLSFDSFRNAWQLDGAGQSALRALCEWHNGLPREANGLSSRTLLAVASRMPKNVRELSHIKGVSASLAKNHGSQIVALCQRARATAPVGEELEPSDYASFDDLVREARLMLARAESCRDSSIAPDLALPMALVRRMHQRAKSAGSLAAARLELTGWRAEVLEPGFSRHIERLGG